MSNVLFNNLTLKQIRFVDQFIETANATEAASRVYHTTNRNTARSIGAENLAKPAIKEAIEARINESMPFPDVFIKGQLFNIANDGRSESSKLKALEMLAKMAGLYESKEKAQTPVIQIHFVESRNENFKNLSESLHTEQFYQSLPNPHLIDSEMNFSSR